MATYQVGFWVVPSDSVASVWRMTPTQFAALLTDIDSVIPRASWSSEQALAWKGAWKGLGEHEDHDCDIYLNDNKSIKSFSFRIDLRQRAIAEKVLSEFCSICLVHDLQLRPFGNDIVMDPDFERVLSYCGSSFHVRLLAIQGELSHEFALPIELTNLSYDEYNVHTTGIWFDPIGASSISIRFEPATNGYHCWWRFEASESDVDRLVQECDCYRLGPTWSEGHISLEEDDLHPNWWVPGQGCSNRLIRWLFDPRDHLKLNGYWEFQYDLESHWCFGRLLLSQ